MNDLKKKIQIPPWFCFVQEDNFLIFPFIHTDLWLQIQPWTKEQLKAPFLFLLSTCVGQSQTHPRWLP